MFFKKKSAASKEVLVNDRSRDLSLMIINPEVNDKSKASIRDIFKLTTEEVMESISVGNKLKEKSNNIFRNMRMIWNSDLNNNQTAALLYITLTEYGEFLERTSGGLRKNSTGLQKGISTGKPKKNNKKTK